MKIDLESRPSYGMAVVHLDQGETFVAESGAMVAMTTGLSAESKFNGVGGGGFGGWLKAALAGLARKFLAGESMFVNHYQATADGQQLMLAPAMVGDVMHIPISGREITVQATSYLASTPDVDVSLVWGGLSMLFSGEGAFFLACSGDGELLINTYGGFEEVEVNGSYRVDTGHLVAFEGDLEYKIKKAGGWKSTLLSGEGLVLEFTGTGKLWLQSRAMGSLISFITPHLPR